MHSIFRKKDTVFRIKCVVITYLDVSIGIEIKKIMVSFSRIFWEAGVKGGMMRVTPGEERYVCADALSLG